MYELKKKSAVILEPKKIRPVTVYSVSPCICNEVTGLNAIIFIFWTPLGDFPGDPVVKNTPANTGDNFYPWSIKIPHAMEQLSHAPQLLKSVWLEPVLHNKRSPQSLQLEKPSLIDEDPP